MKKLFRIFKTQGTTGDKTAFAKGIPDIEKEEINLYIPMAFDFTAYFDDNELENNAEDIPHKNSLEDTNTEFFCTNDEKCNELLYSSNSQQFECCIN